MQLSSRRLWLLGIAVLLTHCAEADLQPPTSYSDPRLSAGTRAAQLPGEKRKDTRSSLVEVSSQGARSRRMTTDLAADARAYAVSVAERAGVKSPVFTDFKISRGNDGLSHVRLHQMHDGLRVWGADVVVHATDRELTGLAGSVATHVDRLV